MRISDRAIGYFSILALLCIFTLVALGMYNAHKDVSNTALVDFDELGSLQPEDVVVIRGYKVGSIGKVTWLGDRSRVQIKFDGPMVIREGTQFNNINYALMGQRRLEIVPSKTGEILPEDFVHTGHFEPGVAEALRLMEDVNAQITNVREAVMLLAKGDSSHASAQKLYEQAVGGIEAFLENADQTLNVMTPKLNEVFAQVESASNTLIDITNQADTAVQVATEAVNEKLKQAEDLIRAISESSEKAAQFIAEMENTPAVDKLLNSKDAAEKIIDVVGKLDALVAAIDTKGIKMYDENGKEVKLFSWSRMNLIGKTARRKAKDRAEKGESLPE